MEKVMTRFKLLVASATLALLTAPAFAGSTGIGGVVGGVTGAVSGVVGSVTGSTGTGTTSTGVASAGVTGSSDSGTTATANAGDSTQANIKLFGKQATGTANASTGIANTRATATILGANGTKAKVNAGLLGGTAASLGLLGDGTAAISLSIGGDEGSGGGGGGGGGSGGGGGGGGIGTGNYGGAFGTLSVAEQQAAKIKCRNVLASPVRYDPQVVTLCRLIASL
jgi:hypothetical protein